ncbi:hypothetical protein [Lignipirellula cremea]|uniref:hypothetical protein n=1 Tax=Lignipirellula cremea TaxID=2528010 RepID=UPI0018D23A92|nr:hypothetical protein [Lignipirellula cremea]
MTADIYTGCIMSQVVCRMSSVVCHDTRGSSRRLGRIFWSYQHHPQSIMEERAQAQP